MGEGGFVIKESFLSISEPQDAKCAKWLKSPAVSVLVRMSVLTVYSELLENTLTKIMLEYGIYSSVFGKSRPHQTTDMCILYVSDCRCHMTLSSGTGMWLS